MCPFCIVLFYLIPKLALITVVRNHVTIANYA